MDVFCVHKPYFLIPGHIVCNCIFEIMIKTVKLIFLNYKSPLFGMFVDRDPTVDHIANTMKRWSFLSFSYMVIALQVWIYTPEWCFHSNLYSPICMYAYMYVPTMLAFLNTFFSNKTYSLIKMAICSVEHRYTCM